MTILEIVKGWLKKHGYDGFYVDAEKQECVCRLPAIMTCGEILDCCSPGYLAECPKGCGRHTFHIVATKPQEVAR